MRSFLLLAILSTAICVSVSASAASWYVKGSVSSSGDGTSWETALKTMQEGIDKTLEGDTVTVAEGIYIENIQFNGKNIVLTSTDPLDPSVVASTIIDGNKAGSVVTFSGTETETCVLSGFTIRNGETSGYGGGICGGTDPDRTHATIQNNTITNNSAVRGAGLSDCDGTIQNNTIMGNSAGYLGGGLAGCNGTIQKNTITGNLAGYGGGLGICHGTIQNNTITGNSAQYGGGLFLCAGTIQNNTITGNSAQSDGGGLSDCAGTIQNNTISDNSAYHGGGLCLCRGTIQNNTITGNSGQSDGGGLSDCAGTIQNNTIMGNSAGYLGGGLAGCNGTIQNNTITGNSADVYGGGLSDCDGTIQNNTITGNSADVYGGGLSDCDGTIRNCIIWGNRAPSGPQLYESGMPSFSCIQGWTGGGQGNIRPKDPLFVNAPGGDYHLKAGSPCIDAGVNYHWFVWPQRDGDGNCRLAGLALDMGCYEYGSSSDADGDLLSDADESAAETDPLRDDSDGDGLRDGLELLRGSDPLQVTAPGILNVPSDFATIQESLCVSVAGDEIIVAPGTYRENLQFCGPDIILRSSDPGDASVVGSTVIDGGGAGPVVSFMGGETEACVLAGFTIRNGSAQRAGGIRGSGTLATIQNNTITDNSAEGDGGGLAYCGGAIQNNTITANSADWGGGGLAYCNGTIQNNTITGNSAKGSGGAVYECGGTIRNCILWANTAPSNPQLQGIAMPSYCCIEGWTGGGRGNTASEPRFVDGNAGDYRLQERSPCIDAGASGYWFTWPQWDGDGSCRLVGLAVDMGCYEYGSSADADGDLLSDADESAAGTDLLRDDSDGDGLRDGLELLRGSNPLQVTPPGILNVPSDIATIQQSLCVSLAGDVIIVAPGTYRENLQFFGPDIILRSSDPGDAGVVASTVIDGGGAGPVVSFVGGESEACVLAGFTIRGGDAEPGGGIIGGTESNQTQATINNNVITGNSAARGGALCWCDGAIRNNTITGNTATEAGGLAYCDGSIQNNTITGNTAQEGGGLYGCGGTIQNNTVTGNSAHLGGGLYGCGGTIQNNTITGNSAGDGGGLIWCNGTIQNNTITGNSAGDCGAGLYGCDGTIQNNTIMSNSAEYGGGLWDCDGTIQNNTITGNWAGESGGGLALCGGTIQNNTITGNSAGDSGAGLYGCDGTIQNNTITGNSAGEYGGGLYWCGGTIQNNTITGNWAGESSGGLFSCGGTIRNCIVWGNTAPSDPQLDESSIPTFSCIEGWSGGGEGNTASDPSFLDAENGDFRLLPDSPCVDAGLNDPELPQFDIAGMHRIMFGGKSLTVDMGAYEFHIWPPTENAQTGEIILKWSSLTGKTYSVYHSSDMLFWDVLADNIASGGDAVTTWIDSMGPVLPPGVRIRYYKVIENQ